LLITLVKISLDLLGNDRMSVTFDDGDNPLTHFVPLCSMYFYPLIPTVYGHYDILMTTFSPL